jgi:cytidylate kinase
MKWPVTHFVPLSELESMLINDRVGARVSNFAYASVIRRPFVRHVSLLAKGQPLVVEGRVRREEGGRRKEQSREIL